MRKDDEDNVIDQSNTNQALPIERRAGNFPARFAFLSRSSLALKNICETKRFHIFAT
jgi:hypothetical protein